MQDYLYDLADHLSYKQRELQRSSPLGLIERRRQQLDEITARLQTQMEHLLALRQERLRSAALRLHSLSPLLTIARGYAIVRRQRDQAIVTGPQEVQDGEMLTLQVKDGFIAVQVRENIESIRG